MTLSSQLPRSSSLTSPSRRRLLAPALVAAFGVAAAAYLYLASPGATPTADKVASNAVPVIAPLTPNPVAKPATPDVRSASETKPVANTVAPAPAPTPAAPVAPATTLAKPALTTPAASPGAPAPATSRPAPTLPSALARVSSDPLGARLALTEVVNAGSLTGPDLATAIDSLRELNAKLVFSPAIAAGDPFMREYTVESGDTLAKIAKKLGVQTDWRFIQRINGLKSERSLRVGQRIKVPVGAFHAEVTKSSYMMRVYAGEGPGRVIVAVYPVGLGELNSTPTGAFMVRPKSKLVNPEWRNPRTGEHFAPDDPKNPIGERWIGLVGVEAQNQGFKGYGIHGTTEPESIGKQASMGCVRMHDADVAAVYEMLTEPNSTIVISP